MARADNTYSRLVSWLKVAFPLAALAILSTLFLVAERLDPETAIPFAERDAIDDLVDQQGISGPVFAAVTDDGTAIQLSAASARPDQTAANMLRGHDLRAQIDIANGPTITITAPEGFIDADSKSTQMQGGTRLISTLGYVVETDTIMANVTQVSAETTGAVQATGPIGSLEAGRMVMQQDDAGRHLLRFTDGVRLIYRPQP